MTLNALKYHSGKTFIDVIDIETKNNGITVTLYDAKKAISPTRIFFEWNNNSEVRLNSENVSIESSNLSNFRIIKQPNSKILHLLLITGEGSLELNAHSFKIKGSNILNIEILPQNQNFYIDGNIMEFWGFTNSAKLNTEDIMITDLEYWIKYEPEKINAYTVVVLVFITLFQVYMSLSNSNRERRNERRIIVKEYIKPFYEYIGNIFHRLGLIKDMDEEHDYNQYFKDYEKFHKMLDNLEVYLEKDDYERIYKYEEKIDRFYLIHRRIEDQVKEKHGFQSLTAQEAYDLFDNLLSEIKDIMKKYNY